MLEVKVLHVYHDGWREKSIDDVYLETMKNYEMEGLVDFLVLDEYNGYSILFYEFSKLTKIFSEVYPSKMKNKLATFMKAAILLMVHNNDLRDAGETSDNSFKEQMLKLLAEYEYKANDLGIVRDLFNTYKVEFDYESITFSGLDLKIERTYIELEDEE